MYVDKAVLLGLARLLLLLLLPETSERKSAVTAILRSRCSEESETTLCPEPPSGRTTTIGARGVGRPEEDDEPRVSGDSRAHRYRFVDGSKQIGRARGCKSARPGDDAVTGTSVVKEGTDKEAEAEAEAEERKALLLLLLLLETAPSLKGARDGTPYVQSMSTRES